MKGHVEKALQSSGGQKVAANPAKAEKEEKEKPKKEKPKKGDKDQPREEKGQKETKGKTEKPKKESPKKTSDAASSVAAAPGNPKGKGKKSEPGKGSSVPMSREDRAKLPCMYFAYDSCTKGAKCPYLHDKNNLFKGPKPQARQKSSTSATATVSAGVARFIAGAAGGSTIKGAEAARASCSNAPSSGQEQSVGVLSDAKCKAQKFLKRTKGRVKQPGMFEKVFKRIAAMAAFTDPTCPRQEFLIDSGAGRNLISKKSLAGAMGSFLRCLS